MKKIVALLLILALAVAMVACDGNVGKDKDKDDDGTNTSTDTTNTDDDDKDKDDDDKDKDDDDSVMTYEEYMAAELDDEVVIEGYVQAKQSWWEDKATVYLQDEDGAYFLYELACSEEDYAKLTVGTKIRVTGFKAAWDGEIEIVDGTFEFVEDEAFVAPVKDVTAFLGSEELVNYQNQYVLFKGMTVKSIEFKNGEPGDDIYVNLTKDGAEYSFCVERYLTDPETKVYADVSALQAGDVIDVVGFLYWWNGPNTHITSVAKIVAE